MSIESRISYELNKHPGIKKAIKRSYQLGMYAISPKVKSEGNIARVSPDDGKEYFFGYYDKSPWDGTGRYILCMRANNTWSDVSPKEKAEIILIDTQDNSKTRKLAETSAWNVQQSCMLQWLGPDFSSHILYNDCRDGKYCAVILELETGKERIIDAPVYTVSQDGKTALTLDFSRLYSLRPGYGYYNVPEKTKGIALPDSTAVWVIDIEKNEVKPLLKYTDFAAFQPRKEMQEDGSVHKVNHLMISPNGKRFMVLYRWFVGQRKYTRLITCNVDGSDMYLLSDDDMVSHCCWKNDHEILAFENKKDGGSGYYLMKDKTQEYKHLWTQYSNDGHPSYSPDGKWVVTDSYPNRARVADIKILKDEEKSGRVIAKVFAPFKYDNDTRCDLHPRWSRDGRKICFDSVFEGHRGLYTVDAINSELTERIIPSNPLVSCVIPTYKRSDTLTRAIDSALSQTYTNIEILVVDDNEPGDEFCEEVKRRLKIYEGNNRVRYVAQEHHINGAAARNAGIKAANGFYIAFLDDDDEWNPLKIEKQVEFLSRSPEYRGATCLYQMMNGDQVIRKCPEYTSDNLQFKVLMREVAICTPTFIGEKEAIEKFGGFNETLLRHQDLQFFGDFLESSSIYPLPELLVTVHADSSANKASSKKLIEIKEQYLRIEQPIISKYSKKEQKRIKGAHYFEVVLVALREKNIPIIIKYLAKNGLNIESYKDLIKRIKSR